MDILPFDSLCRICLKFTRENEFKSIFHFNLDSIILECLSIQILETEQLPSRICNECLIQLLDANALRKKALKCDFILKNNLFREASYNQTELFNTIQGLQQQVIVPSAFNFVDRMIDESQGKPKTPTNDLSLIVNNMNECNSLKFNVDPNLTDGSNIVLYEVLQDFKINRVGAENIVTVAIEPPLNSLPAQVIGCQDSNSLVPKKIISCKFCTFEATDRHNFQDHVLKNHVNIDVEVRNRFKMRETRICDRRKITTTNVAKSGSIVTCELCMEKIGKPFVKDHMFNKHFGGDSMKKVFNMKKMNLWSQFSKMLTNNLKKNIESLNNADNVNDFDDDLTYESICNGLDGSTKREKSGKKSISICPVCGKSYTNVRYFNRHLQFHKTIRRNTEYSQQLQRVVHSCNFCKFITPYQVNLEQHTKYYHLEQHICHHCGLSLTRKQLKNHLRKHNPKDRCVICHLEFTRYSMANHMRSHLPENERLPNRKPSSGMSNRDETRVSCVVCSKLVKKCHMTKHINMVHKRLSAVECEVCGFQARDRYQMKCHERIHTGERPYQCPICPKRFGVKAVLNRHMPLHTGERKYTCKMCQKGFIQLPSLKTHIKRHHRLNVIDDC